MSQSVMHASVHDWNKAIPCRRRASERTQAKVYSACLRKSNISVARGALENEI